MRFLREPLFHFLILGAGLFVAAALFGERNAQPRDTVAVTPATVERLVELWRRTWQRPPTARELDGLIDDHVREEILYREALAIGLDRDDTIVRRRMRQKLEFLAEDLMPVPEPTDDDLEAFLTEHAEGFRIEPRWTLRQVFVSVDRRGDGAGDHAEQLLADLRAGDDDGGADTLGDPLPLPSHIEDLPQSEITRRFGTEFSGSLAALPLAEWTGPVESAYGLHLVRVDARTPARIPELEEVRSAVLRDWTSQRRRAANDAFFLRLREKYEVTVELPEWAASAPESAGAD